MHVMMPVYMTGGILMGVYAGVSAQPWKTDKILSQRTPSSNEEARSWYVRRLGEDKTREKSVLPPPTAAAAAVGEAAEEEEEEEEDLSFEAVTLTQLRRSNTSLASRSEGVA